MTCEQWLNLCNVNSSLLSKSVERRPRIFGFPVRKKQTRTPIHFDWWGNMQSTCAMC